MSRYSLETRDLLSAGDEDLLEQTLQEEKATDEKLTMLAESEINPAALQQAA